MICYIVIFIVVCIMAPYVFGYTPVVIQSASMEPSIKTGSIVYCHKVDTFDELKIDDVITFQEHDEGSMVTHRIKELHSEEKTIRTKGDKNDNFDKQILNFNNIKGRVESFTIPIVGYCLAYMQNLYVIAIMAGMIILNVALSYVGNNK